MASLSLKHINKTYPNGFEAVKDFNLEIEDKEFIIFVGPSGCGKSTTLRMIAGLEDITSGELKIGDRVVNDVEPKDRDIAMVFQNYALYLSARSICCHGLCAVIFSLLTTDSFRRVQAVPPYNFHLSDIQPTAVLPASSDCRPSFLRSEPYSVLYLYTDMPAAYASAQFHTHTSLS